LSALNALEKHYENAENGHFFYWLAHLGCGHLFAGKSKTQPRETSRIERRKFAEKHCLGISKIQGKSHRCAHAAMHQTLYTITNMNAMNGAIPGSMFKDGTRFTEKAMLAVDIVFGQKAKMLDIVSNILQSRT